MPSGFFVYILIFAFWYSIINPMILYICGGII